MLMIDVHWAIVPCSRRPLAKAPHKVLDCVFVNLELFLEVDENMVINRVVE